MTGHPEDTIRLRPDDGHSSGFARAQSSARYLSGSTEFQPDDGYPADYAQTRPDGRIVCLLCPHACVLREGQTGRCLARSVRGGLLRSDSYGAVTSLALDPIEKKPLNFFHPGSRILSAGSFGCNLDCLFCQNASIAQSRAPFHEMSPQHLVDAALRARRDGNIGLAYTYNEPLTGIEFVRDSAELARQSGLLNVLVSNGFANPRPFADLLPWLDALNLDLKGFSDAYYRKVCGGSLGVVKANIAAAVSSGKHVEVTTLIVTGENDSDSEMDALASWLSGLSADIPLHLSRFFPSHRLRDSVPTPTDTLHRLAAVAQRYLRHVLLGNVR